jgi:hypothetical protein
MKKVTGLGGIELWEPNDDEFDKIGGARTK